MPVEQLLHSKISAVYVVWGQRKTSGTILLLRLLSSPVVAGGVLLLYRSYQVLNANEIVASLSIQIPTAHLEQERRRWGGGGAGKR